MTPEVAALAVELRARGLDVRENDGFFMLQVIADGGLRVRVRQYGYALRAEVTWAPQGVSVVLAVREPFYASLESFRALLQDAVATQHRALLVLEDLAALD